MSDDSIGVIQELRLRRWACEHYVRPELRRTTWHPIVLDEMARRDAEAIRAESTEPAPSAYVPLAPGEIRFWDPPHPDCTEPQLLKQLQYWESGLYIPG